MMNKEIIKKMLTDGYNKKAFTTNYIMGYIKDGVVYATFADASVVDDVLILDKASRGAGYSLRFKPNNKQRDFLMVFGSKTVVLGSKERFENEFAESKYNRGEIFEKWVSEYYGQEWEKDNVPFTKGPDVVIDDVPYQVKFEKATFTNEKSLASL